MAAKLGAYDIVSHFIKLAMEKPEIDSQVSHFYLKRISNKEICFNIFFFNQNVILDGSILSDCLQRTDQQTTRYF